MGGRPVLESGLCQFFIPELKPPGDILCMSTTLSMNKCRQGPSSYTAEILTRLESAITTSCAHYVVHPVQPEVLRAALRIWGIIELKISRTPSEANKHDKHPLNGGDRPYLSLYLKLACNSYKRVGALKQRHPIRDCNEYYCYCYYYYYYYYKSVGLYVNPIVLFNRRGHVHGY